MSKKLPSPDDLRKVLRYEPDTGKLFWLFRTGDMFPDTGYGGQNGSASRWNARFAGREALTEVFDGYKCGRVFGAKVKAHRVIWAMVSGSWPTDLIDHKNGVRSDNRICNLREADQYQNSWNRNIGSKNKSGFKGVSLDAASGMWIAQISIRIGRFETAKCASDAYVKACEFLHGDFAKIVQGRE